MKVAKKDAIAVLSAVGIKNAKGLDDKKLGERINLLHKVKEVKGAVKKIKDKAVANLLKALLEALGAGKKVELTDDKKPTKSAGKAAADEDEDEEEGDEDEDGDEEEGDESEDGDEDEEEGDDGDGDEEEGDESEDGDEDEDEGDEDSEEEGDEEEGDDDESEDDDEEEEEEEDEKPAKKKKDKGGKGKGKGKKGDDDEDKPAKKKKKAKSEVVRNAFGHRENTRAARIDNAITDKLQTMAKIGEKAKYSKPFHGHMKQMVDKGFVYRKDTDDGVKYALTKKGIAAKAKKA
jgi:hypothetical protein